MEDSRFRKSSKFKLFTSSTGLKFSMLAVAATCFLNPFSSIASEGVLEHDLPKTKKKATTVQTIAQSDSLAQLYESLDLISEMVSKRNLVSSPIFDEKLVEPITLEGRLNKIQQEIPLTYNAYVQQFINKYSQNQYIQYLSRMKGLGEYYFTIYDRVFDEVGLPKHIKYLSIVESALNPHAVSRVGATGPWQFMYATAKVYGLQMNKDEDQRKDPIAASYAAANYLLKVYEQFGDWHLAIAAYNCGPGNVARAIERSGIEKPDFWQLIDFLPKETRNYVPAFIAMTYMMEYHEDFGIESIPSGLSSNFEVVTVKQAIPLEAIASALDTDLSQIKTLNPAYKRNLVPASVDNPRRIVLPMVTPDKYQDLYAVLYEKGATTDVVKFQVASLKSNSEDNGVGSGEDLIHKVKKGENLALIAQKHDITVQDLKVWNGLKSNNLSIGQNLKIQKSTKSNPTISERKSTTQIASYVVKKGDSLSSIASAHKGVTVASLKSVNGLKSNDLRPGMKLKLR